MRKGGGKQKGGSFEREVAKALSLWVTHGQREDVFWRSAMSGGRATVAHRREIKQSNAAGRAWPALPPVRQAGDICATAPEGHALTDRWYIECKHTRDLRLWGIFDNLRSRDSLHNYWLKAVADASRYGRKAMVIAKQNLCPIILCVPLGSLDYLKIEPSVRLPSLNWGADLCLFNEVLKHKFRP